MKATSIVLMAGMLACSGMVWAGQAKVEGAKSNAPASRAKQAEEDVRLDGDQAYKANCTRCHLAPRKFSDRKMATIMRHMRVRANLTEEETRAIRHYLTR